MITLKITCDKEDRYQVYVNKKKINTNKQQSLKYLCFDYIYQLPQMGSFEIIIKRKFNICLGNAVSNIFNAIGLGDWKYYAKISNIYKVKVNNDSNIDEGMVNIIVNTKDNIVINKIALSDGLSL